MEAECLHAFGRCLTGPQALYIVAGVASLVAAIIVISANMLSSMISRKEEEQGKKDEQK